MIITLYIYICWLALRSLHVYCFRALLTILPTICNFIHVNFIPVSYFSLCNLLFIIYSEIYSEIEEYRVPQNAMYDFCQKLKYIKI